MGSAPMGSRMHVRHPPRPPCFLCRMTCGQVLSLPPFTEGDAGLKELVSGELHQRTFVFQFPVTTLALTKLFHWSVSF